MILKDLIEIRKSQITIELLDLCINLSMFETIVSHSVVIFSWVLQGIQIIVLNIPSTQLFRQFVSLNMLYFTLKILYAQEWLLLKIMKFAKP